MTDAFNAGVETAAHLGIDPEPDDPDMPKVRRRMESILARLRADGVVH